MQPPQPTCASIGTMKLLRRTAISSRINFSTPETAFETIYPALRKTHLVKLSTAAPALFFLLATSLLSAYAANLPRNYKGTPYKDDHFTKGAQSIPGKVLCAYYDRGGEGVAYHDTEAKNLGSGTLNPTDGTYLNQFRMDEGVDISYTKFHNPKNLIDDNPYDQVQPPENLLYVGWTVPGEWFNVTVEVAHAGLYAADLLYTSHNGGTISVDVNGKLATKPITVVSTFNASEPIPWRQFHHWNLAPAMMKIPLPAGKSLLTVHILSGGNMNFAYLDFKEAR